MAEVLDAFPVSPTKRGGYGKFCDGKVYRVVAGVDFINASYAVAVNGFYVAAMRQGRKARIHLESKSPLTLIVQALPRQG